MMRENKAGTPLSEKSAWWGAEDRGFEPRMGSLPNRISSAAP
jgi:hypothetical protein